MLLVLLIKYLGAMRGPLACLPLGLPPRRPLITSPPCPIMLSLCCTPLQAGAVAGLRRIRQAARTARLVMEHTRHTLLAGDLATQFAVQMGLRESSLSSPRSLDVWRRW